MTTRDTLDDIDAIEIELTEAIEQLAMRRDKLANSERECNADAWRQSLVAGLLDTARRIERLAREL